MAHENGGWMNSGQREAVKDEADTLEQQQWQCHPGTALDVKDGMLTGARLVKLGILDSPLELLGLRIGTVIKTGVSAYERIA